MENYKISVIVTVYNIKLSLFYAKLNNLKDILIYLSKEHAALLFKSVSEIPRIFPHIQTWPLLSAFSNAHRAPLRSPWQI